MKKVIIYTAGKENKPLEVYGSGYVLVDTNGKEVERAYLTSFASHRNDGWNIAGEIEAVIRGMESAARRGCSEIEVRFNLADLGKMAETGTDSCSEDVRHFAHEVARRRERAVVRFIPADRSTDAFWCELAEVMAKFRARSIGD